jgi:hypothetical protein
MDLEFRFGFANLKASNVLVSAEANGCQNLTQILAMSWILQSGLDRESFANQTASDWLVE